MNLNLPARHDTPRFKGGDLCMKGGIYSDEKCPVCGSKFQNNFKDGLTCPNHPKIRAHKLSVRFRKTHARFADYDSADQFLSVLRDKFRRGKYDDRDYQKHNPLGVATLAQEWRDKKEGKVKPGTMKCYVSYVALWENYFGNKNIKDVDYSDIEDFIDSLSHLSSKTKFNVLTALKDFFTWVWKRNKKTFDTSDYPEFPTVRYTLGRRKIVSKDVQIAIVEEIRNACPEIKVYLAIKWLCTYGNIRPGELLKLEEANIDLDMGRIYFWDTKENDWKWITLLPEDVQVIKSFPPSLPNVRFFRHEKRSGVQYGEPYGQKHLYKWWKRACKNLGIEGVDLYGGTRHSSATALNEIYSPEEIKKHWTKHSTSKAFDRYLDPDTVKDRDMYIAAVPGKKLVKKSNQGEDDNILKIDT